MQTILGAGGAIGTDLAKELKNYTSQIRLVSRNPVKVNATDDLFPADLTDADAVDKAVEGSKIVYLVVGLEYKTSVWEKTWPGLMRNVIEACKKHRAKLVFFDNMYLYDPASLGHMTEESPVKPTSKKGKVRAKIAQMILDEVNREKLTALIARAPDFIGPKNSMAMEVIYTNLAKGKKANWFGSLDKKHSFIFTHEAAKATALLGNTPNAYNQVWHLPTAKAFLTVREWVGLFAKELNVEPKASVLPGWSFGILGLFVPILKEFKEMLYQYDRDYFFDSSKFENRFNFQPTPPAEGIKWAVEKMKTVN